MRQTTITLLLLAFSAAAFNCEMGTGGSSQIRCPATRSRIGRGLRAGKCARADTAGLISADRLCNLRGFVQWQGVRLEKFEISNPLDGTVETIPPRSKLVLFVYSIGSPESDRGPPSLLNSTT